ncbi:MAG: RNA polymerase sigma factor [Defluviitaleaceae bacterium]|nr:RNA polymerase sigma factor [Defluviitaleaceae bacterium]
MVHTIVKTAVRNENRTETETAYSLELMFHRHHKSVYNYIAYRLNNHHDAEELTSDVFVKAIQNFDRYNIARPMEAWLITIAKNTVTDHLRKIKHRKFAPEDAIVGMISPEGQPEEIAVINEKNRQLMSCLARLKDKERQILSMKFATELKHSEIGEILGISPSQVGVIVHRAMGKLRKYFEEVYKDER